MPIANVELLGSSEKVTLNQTADALKVTLPASAACKYAYTLKLTSKINHAASPSSRRLAARGQGLPVTIAAKCTFVPLTKAVTVFIHRASRYRWIAKVAVPICIGPPAFRHVVPSRFRSIVKPTFSKSFMRGAYGAE